MKLARVLLLLGVAMMVAPTGVWAIRDAAQPPMGERAPAKKFILPDTPNVPVMPSMLLGQDSGEVGVSDNEEPFVPHANSPLDYESPMSIYDGINRTTPHAYPRTGNWDGIRDGY
jgi:hypothetical protein